MCLIVKFDFYFHADHPRFDSSQYAFFGDNVLEEVELGGLEDDDNDVGFVGLNNDENRFSSLGDREEVSFPM